jgi:uncharacterized membrane protein
MTRTIVLFLSIFVSGLTAGITLYVWLTGNPAELSYPTFVESMQSDIRALRTSLLIVTSPGLPLLALTAFLMRRDRPRVYFVVAALLLFIVASLSTRLGNIPINDEVMTWDLRTAPEAWQELIGEWWRWHQIRFVAMTAAFALLVGVAVSKARNA